MSNRDAELSSKLIGSWRMPEQSGYSRTIALINDGTFKQTISPKKDVTAKLLGFFEGDQYHGSWHIENQTLKLNYNSLPKSPLNISIVGIKIPIADLLNQFMELFQDHEYSIKSIDPSKVNFSKESWDKVG